MFPVIRGLKEGVVVKLKKKIKNPMTEVWKGENESIKSFFGEEIYTTKALIKRK